VSATLTWNIVGQGHAAQLQLFRKLSLTVCWPPHY